MHRRQIPKFFWASCRCHWSRETSGELLIERCLPYATYAMNRIFLLSPAQTGGKRAELIHNPRAGFPLARTLQRGEGVALGEVFSFLSGLYFRGKLLYATAFSCPPAGFPPALVITSNRGLLAPETVITLKDLADFSRVQVDCAESRYRRPIQRDARRLAAECPDCQFILLGSVGSRKYASVLLPVLRNQLLFPEAFVGRGDMSRGGLLLRSVRGEQELEYTPLAGAVVHGSRPPKLRRITE
jgi:hypothetical protein